MAGGIVFLVLALTGAPGIAYAIVAMVLGLAYSVAGSMRRTGRIGDRGRERSVRAARRARRGDGGGLGL